MIILYDYNTFHVVIAKGYSGRRSQAVKRKKESDSKGGDEGAL